MSKRLKNVRIELPRGLYYDVLTAGAKLHGAPSLSKYILNAAMTYTQTYLEGKKDELEQRKEEGIRLRNTESNDSGTDHPDERQDTGTSSGHGELPSTSEPGDKPSS